MASSNYTSIPSLLAERIQWLINPNASANQQLEEKPRPRTLVVVMCVLFSTLLWLISAMSETYTRTIEMPTRVQNIPSHEALLSPPPEVVHVKVQGEGLQLLRLYYNPVAIEINAANSQISLETAAVNVLPQSVRFESASPSTFLLQKEERIERTIPVDIQAHIQWPATHDIIAPPTVSPDSIRISGARSHVESLDSWPTTRFEFTDLKDSLNTLLPLVDSLDGLVRLNTRQVRLRARVTEFTETTREVKVRLTGAPYRGQSVSLEPEWVQVRYRVPLDQYEEAESVADFTALVSYESMRRDTTGFIEPELSLPESVIIRDPVIFPKRLRYFDLLQDD